MRLLRACLAIALGWTLSNLRPHAPLTRLVCAHPRRMQDGKTVLFWARQHGQKEIVQLLTARDTTTPVETKVRAIMTCVCVCVRACVPQWLIPII